MPDTLMDKLRVTACEGVERIRPTLEPDQDWLAVAFFADEDTLTEAVIDPEFFANEERKDALAEQLAQMARDLKAKVFAFVTTAWILHVEPTEDGTPPQVRVSEHPDRREAVQIVVMDGECTEVTHAEITRHPNEPPTLGEWQTMGRKWGHTGRFVEQIQEALR